MADAGSYLMLPIGGRIKEVKIILTLFLEREVEAFHPQKTCSKFIYLHLLEKKCYWLFLFYCNICLVYSSIK